MIKDDIEDPYIGHLYELTYVDNDTKWAIPVSSFYVSNEKIYNVYFPLTMQFRKWKETAFLQVINEESWIEL